MTHPIALGCPLHVSRQPIPYHALYTKEMTPYFVSLDHSNLGIISPAPFTATDGHKHPDPDHLVTSHLRSPCYDQVAPLLCLMVSDLYKQAN